MLKSYDMIASLGGNCSAAMQLKNRGLRREAYPLDWVYMESDKSVRWLCSAFENGFADFALRQNLVLMSELNHSGSAKYAYRDVHSGFCFIHHFNERVDLDQAAYDCAMVTMRKRMDRFLHRLKEAQSVLFILATNIPMSPDVVVELRETLRQCYPDKTIDIHFKEFSATLSNPLALVEAWSDKYGFAGGERHVRPAYPYSFNLAGYEWAFLDELSLTDKFPHAKHKKWYDKYIYKLWKTFGKYLNDKGYGVLNVRFK